MNYTKGQRWYWNDPDEGLCSDYGTIINVVFEGIITLRMDSGSIVECYSSELS